MAEKKVNLVVYRTNITEDGVETGSRYESFEVPFNHRSTVMDGLEYIRTKLDGSIMYRHSCHHGSCGTCGMLINRERKLACITSIEEMETDTIEITPLQTLDRIGDLAVHPRRLFRDFPKNTTYIRKSEFNPKAALPEEIDGYQRFEDCIECGLCVSACPVIAPFTGPAAIAAYSREITNRPERKTELLPNLDTEHGVFACRRALKCSQVCPTGVNPAKHIAVLRREIEKNGK
jgi:succinate dehydrogenase/fumarate reductase iron-sulfur protein